MPLANGWSHQAGERHGIGEKTSQPTHDHEPTRRTLLALSYTIFEGTSEIPRLVIARAISGLRLE
jgi:alkylation response protein AidB-like acyl-CoA dehydrogenase